MVDLVYRDIKGTRLSKEEGDANLRALNAAVESNVAGIAGLTESLQLQVGNLLYEPQIPIASYGDSIANISAYANFDLRSITSAVGYQAERMGFALPAALGGLVYWTANCGISGETTTQMLARENASATATRKSIADAASTGARYIRNSIGLNDIQQLAGGASGGTITSVVNTAVANTVFLLKRQMALGMYPLTTSLLGYALTTATAPEIATRVTAIGQFNTDLGALIEAADGALGSWIDVYADVTTGTGAWKAGYDDGDGAHPGVNGSYVVEGLVAAEFRRVSNILRRPMYVLPVAVLAGTSTNNMFLNSDFSSSSAGQATSTNIYQVSGTATITNSIVNWRGRNWQEILFTSLTLDGSGNCAVQIDVLIPNTYVVSGSKVKAELDVYIDNGAGTAPPIFAWLTRLRATAAYNDVPTFNPTVSPKVLVDHVIDYHGTCGPIVWPSATPSPHTISVAALTSTVGATVRMRVALPRAIPV